MNEFLARMFEEMGARRRRLRQAFGDRGQGLVEFLTFAGLLAGSLGLFLAPWMPGAAPWGFGLPFVFLIGYVLIEWRRQGLTTDRSQAFLAKNAALDDAELNKQLAESRAEGVREETLAVLVEQHRAGAEERIQERIASTADWAAFLWAFACALAGAAAFIIAWNSRPPPPPEPPPWAPPAGTVDSDIGMPPQ